MAQIGCKGLQLFRMYCKLPKDPRVLEAFTAQTIHLTTDTKYIYHTASELVESLHQLARKLSIFLSSDATLKNEFVIFIECIMHEGYTIFQS